MCGKWDVCWFCDNWEGICGGCWCDRCGRGVGVERGGGGGGVDSCGIFCCFIFGGIVICKFKYNVKF